MLRAILISALSLCLASTILSATILWYDDFERGDVSKWYHPSVRLDGNHGGGRTTTGRGVAEPSQDVAHSGNWSLKMTITTPSEPTSGARMFRWLESHQYPGLYYSVWYYFPQVYRAKDWWNVFQWKSKTSSIASRPPWAMSANQREGGPFVDPFFILNVGNRPDGSMFLYLFDWQKRVTYSQKVKNIPVKTWFKVEAFYQCAGDQSGHVTFWQDGVQLMDVANVQTRYSDGDCQWSVDNYAASLNPPSATIYIDDAMINTELTGARTEFSQNNTGLPAGGAFAPVTGAPVAYPPTGPHTARSLVNCVQENLRNAESFTPPTDKEKERFHNVQHHLSEFDRKLAGGGFDNDVLDVAIDDLKNVVENNTLSAVDRDALSQNLSQLRELRRTRGASY
jgi:polysaccharide lyase-like protein